MYINRRKRKWKLVAIACIALMFCGSTLKVDADEVQTTDIEDGIGRQNMENSEESISEESITEESSEDLIEAYTAADGIVPSITYRTHVQTYGWQDWVSDGQLSGTIGESKRLEAIQICLGNTSVSGGLQYRTHVQTYGWQDWVSDGQLSGTVGESKRLEAVQIRLTEELAETYDIYYRVHVQNYGWLGWAKNGEAAGTAGYSKRLEGIQIVLAAKGADAPGSTDNRYLENLKVSYQTHVQNYGWQDFVSNGELSGTTGQSKRLEALKIRLENHEFVPGSVQYRVHVQTYGWQSWVEENQLAGTTGQSKRLEAIEVCLTGEMAETYDIYYRVSIQNYGWTGWAKNGETCGSTGLSKRMEAIEMVLVEKNGPAPGSRENICYRPEYWGIDVSSWQGIINWAKVKEDGADFAMLRITSWDSSKGALMEDPMFAKNAQGALANGIPIGGYVYIYATTPEEAAEEAKMAIEIIKKYKITYPIAFDLEEESQMTTAEKLNNMAMAKAFCDEIEAAGYKTIIYGSPSKLKSYFEYAQLASAYEIWIARYRWSYDEMDFNSSSMREEVYNTGYEGGNWTGLSNVKIWQFTSCGRVAGISGNVDLDLCYKLY